MGPTMVGSSGPLAFQAANMSVTGQVPPSCMVPLMWAEHFAEALSTLSCTSTLQDIVGEEVVNDLTTRGVSEADASLIVKHSMYMFLGLLHKTLQAWLIKHVVAVFQLIVPIIGLVDSDTWEDITVVPNWPIPLVWDGHTELHLVSVLAIVVCLACRGGDGGAHEGATSRAVRLETMGADMITKHATIMNVLTQHLLKEISELKSNKWWQDVVTSISILGLRGVQSYFAQLQLGCIPSLPPRTTTRTTTR